MLLLKKYPEEAPDWSGAGLISRLNAVGGAGGVSEVFLSGRETAGWNLGEDQMLLIQQGSGEVVDWPNGAE